MTKEIFLDAPENFSFRRTIFSHGWCELLPFELDKENWRLSYCFTISNAETPVFATMSDAGDGRVKIEISGRRTNKKTEEKILRDARHVLRIDDDLSDFYKFTKTENRLAWVAETNSGRMLRSPTVLKI